MVRQSNARFAALAFPAVGWWRSHSKLSPRVALDQLPYLASA
jgi:hypothetical protein